jgi:flagellar hook assembly protein FlgD
VELSVYNNLGQKVATLVSENQNTGFHQIEWDASGYAAGVYYYLLRAGKLHQAKKMVFLK